MSEYSCKACGATVAEADAVAAGDEASCPDCGQTYHFLENSPPYETPLMRANREPTSDPPVELVDAGHWATSVDKEGIPVDTRIKVTWVTERGKRVRDWIDNTQWDEADAAEHIGEQDAPVIPEGLPVVERSSEDDAE